MKLCILLALCCWLSVSKAQEIVFDPQHFQAVIQNGAVRSSAEWLHQEQLTSIDGDLQSINQNASTLVLAQAMVYQSLVNVNSALKDGLAVRNLPIVIADMTGYLHQCFKLARSQPYLFAFTANIAQQMEARALALLTDVSAFVLKEGDKVMADYNSRDQLLRKVTTELQIIDGLAYGAWRAMFWAKERGVIASLNPFQVWTNRDLGIANRIINNTKYLMK